MIASAGSVLAFSSARSLLDGKMQDDATYKQCKVVLELATQLAQRDPELKEAYAL